MPPDKNVESLAKAKRSPTLFLCFAYYSFRLARPAAAIFTTFTFFQRSRGGTAAAVIVY